MPYHAEIGSPIDEVHVFNLEEAELRRDVLEPWLGGLGFVLAERRWDPRECRLTILEGPSLEAPDLAGEQSWANALHSAEDVTRRILEATEATTPVRAAAVINADSLDAAMKGLRGGRSLRLTHWSDAVERIDREDPEVAAVILVLRPAESGGDGAG